MRPELEMSQLKELLKVITPMTLVMVLNLNQDTIAIAITDTTEEEDTTLRSNLDTPPLTHLMMPTTTL